MNYSVDEIALEIEVPSRVLRQFLTDEGIEVKRRTNYTEAEFRSILRLWRGTGASNCYEVHGKLIRREDGM